MTIQKQQTIQGRIYVPKGEDIGELNKLNRVRLTTRGLKRRYFFKSAVVEKGCYKEEEFDEVHPSRCSTRSEYMSKWSCFEIDTTFDFTNEIIENLPLQESRLVVRKLDNIHSQSELLLQDAIALPGKVRYTFFPIFDFSGKGYSLNGGQIQIGEINCYFLTTRRSYLKGRRKYCFNDYEDYEEWIPNPKRNKFKAIILLHSNTEELDNLERKLKNK